MDEPKLKLVNLKAEARPQKSEENDPDKEHMLEQLGQITGMVEDGRITSMALILVGQEFAGTTVLFDNQGYNKGKMVFLLEKMKLRMLADEESD